MATACGTDCRWCYPNTYWARINDLFDRGDVKGLERMLQEPHFLTDEYAGPGVDLEMVDDYASGVLRKRYHARLETPGDCRILHCGCKCATCDAYRTGQRTGRPCAMECETLRAVLNWFHSEFNWTPSTEFYIQCGTDLVTAGWAHQTFGGEWDMHASDLVVGARNVGWTEVEEFFVSRGCPTEPDPRLRVAL